ncbi:MAG: lysine-2,3-aminomutase-like protein [Alphaproteobacteria bacterium]|nr:lysine-2,3-aminomutase-like protein [Alphaproteobacteria bacterium]
MLSEKGDLSDSSEGYILSQGGSAHPGLLKRYAYRVTRTVKEAIGKGSGGGIDDPVARQYIPQAEEMRILPEELADPIGDEAYSPVEGVVHRYPDRVLFKPVSVCAVYCRYCFRREMVGPRAGEPAFLSEEAYAAAMDYIRQNPQIFEVILTGGDPLVLSPRRLEEMLREIAAIEHVRIIRIHTRVPLVDPLRVNDALLEVFQELEKPLYMALHVNHVQELTPDVRQAFLRLYKAGVHLLSQSVLLRGVNDDAQALEDLYRALLGLHVKPYYLHHPDLAPGTSHFRVSIEEGQTLMRALQGRLSGLGLPQYMLDIPGGFGKVPLTPCYLEALEGAGRYSVEDYQGRRHVYPPVVNEDEEYE